MVKEDVIEALYESSNIVASKYYKNTNNLTITFKTGQEYVYEGVPSKEYHIFELADSQGVAFNKYLKQFPFSKGDLVDVVLLREQMEQVKQEELKSLEEQIALDAHMIYLAYDTDKVLDPNQIEAYANLLKVYFEKRK